MTQPKMGNTKRSAFMDTDNAGHSVQYMIGEAIRSIELRDNVVAGAGVAVPGHSDPRAYSFRFHDSTDFAFSVLDTSPDYHSVKAAVCMEGYKLFFREHTTPDAVDSLIEDAIERPEIISELGRWDEPIEGTGNDPTAWASQAFNLHADAPITTALLLRKALWLLSQGSTIWSPVLLFDAHGYECAVSLGKGRDETPQVNLIVTLGRIEVTKSYDPGAVYSAKKILYDARTEVIQAVKAPKPLTTSTVRNSVDGEERIQVLCETCLNPGRSQGYADILRIAATGTCRLCTIDDFVMRKYREEEGVIPSV